MAATFSGVVYDPPRADLPHLAVIFKPDGEVLQATVVRSVSEGENLIASVLEQYKKTVDAKSKK